MTDHLKIKRSINNIPTIISEPNSEINEEISENKVKATSKRNSMNIMKNMKYLTTLKRSSLLKDTLLGKMVNLYLNIQIAQS